MPLTNILTFNTRAIVLYTCCLFDLPWLYFVFEIVIMAALCEYAPPTRKNVLGISA